jgi:hypothetical protein
MLPDRKSKRKRKREVDVCIEGMVGGHPVMVCIECRDHKRPADVQWVEAIKAKHEGLPTSALILASRTGFTVEARDVAQGYGIEPISLYEVDHADFPALLKATSSVWTKSVTITVQKVLVAVLPTPNLAAENVVVMPDHAVYAADGTPIGPVGEWVRLLGDSAYARDYLLSHAKEEHLWFQLQWEPRDRSIFLKQTEPETLREIGSIQMKGPCEFKISQFGLRRGALGEIQLAWAKTEIQGQSAMFVATRDKEGVEKIAVHLV